MSKWQIWFYLHSLNNTISFAREIVPWMCTRNTQNSSIRNWLTCYCLSVEVVWRMHDNDIGCLLYTKLHVNNRTVHANDPYYDLSTFGENTLYKYAMFWDLCYWKEGLLFVSLYRYKTPAFLLDVRSSNIRNTTPSSNMQHSHGHTCICRVSALANVTKYILHPGAPFTNMD